MLSTRRTFLRQLGATALLLPASRFAWAAEAARLPRSTPEAEGIASSAISAFLDGLAAAKHEVHGLIIARHGRVVADGWWAPYAPTLRHTLYSMSKSFTSTAVGFAVAEGKLNVEAKVTSFFPSSLPAKISENLAALRVKHLLIMAVGSGKEPTQPMVREEDWVKSFLAHEISHEPGSVFMYNSAATYMCSAIVQKVTGEKIVRYLQPRLFAPLGIEDATWETCPRGICTGGWGLSVPTEALAKFGQLYLQKGQWNGRAILNPGWVEQATRFHIQQPSIAKPTRPAEQNDWQQGYGYQFWRSQHGAYRGDGAFGQFTIVLPEQDTVIAMNSESANMQGQLDLVWEHLLPALKPDALPPDRPAQETLATTLRNLALAIPTAQPDSPQSGRLDGRTFALADNDRGLRNLRFSFGKGLIELTADTHTIAHGVQSWRRGETAFPGTPPRLISGGAPPAGTSHPLVASATWRDETTLELTWRFIETPHRETVTCRFKDDTVAIDFKPSVGKPAAALQGKLSA